MGADDRLVRDMGCKSSRGERDQLALQPRGPTTGQKRTSGSLAVAGAHFWLVLGCPVSSSPPDRTPIRAMEDR
jgi:hypothetical protein